jgi:hypothetical protein
LTYNHTRFKPVKYPHAVIEVALKEFSHSVMRAPVGRPPKQVGRKVVSKSVWLYPDALARVLAHVGPQEVSRFIRDAIDEKLERDRAPAYDAVTMRPAKPNPS